MTDARFDQLVAALRRALTQRGFPATALTSDPATQTLYLALGDERWFTREVSAEDLAGDLAGYAGRVVADWLRAG